MPTNTYVALQRTTVSGSSTSSVTLGSIPQTYTDLVLVINGSATAQVDLRYTLNSDTGSNYSRTYMLGTGSSTLSGRDTSLTYLPISFLDTTQTTCIVNFQNYSNTTTFKTVLERAGNAGSATNAIVGLWRSTAAISSMTLTTSSGTITAGTTFSLYGIKAEAVPTAKATGGTITYDASGNIYHTFTSSGTFTPSSNFNVDYLVVAGGGGGGCREAGGGGAGGFRTATGFSVSSGVGLTVTVGAGGSGSSDSSIKGSNGSDSVFSSITSTGGGGGGSGFNSTSGPGNNGGSGGGGGYTGAVRAGGTGTAGQGNNGGSSSTQGNAGGGGGASAVGAVGTSGSTGGAGGAGTVSSMSGVPVTYAGGGGGAGQSTGGAGGAGGGGTGGTPTSGTTNTGGGGGGSLSGGTSGAAGGSGIVIIRYAG